MPINQVSRPSYKPRDKNLTYAQRFALALAENNEEYLKYSDTGEILKDRDGKPYSFTWRFEIFGHDGVSELNLKSLKKAPNFGIRKANMHATAMTILDAYRELRINPLSNETLKKAAEIDGKKNMLSTEDLSSLLIGGASAAKGNNKADTIIGNGRIDRLDIEFISNPKVSKKVMAEAKKVYKAVFRN